MFEKELKNMRELRKLLERYVKLQKRLGTSDNLDETISRIRKMRDDVEYVMEKREEWRKLLGYND